MHRRMCPPEDKPTSLHHRLQSKKKKWPHNVLGQSNSLLVLSTLHPGISKSVLDVNELTTLLWWGSVCWPLKCSHDTAPHNSLWKDVKQNPASRGNVGRWDIVSCGIWPQHLGSRSDTYRKWLVFFNGHRQLGAFSLDVNPPGPLVQ